MWSGPWTNVARDRDDDPVEWCGHQHIDADEANECDWRPDDSSTVIYVVHRFDPALHSPCIHENHPSECERCRSLRVCIHQESPDECQRCALIESFCLETEV